MLAELKGTDVYHLDMFTNSLINIVSVISCKDEIFSTVEIINKGKKNVCV